MYLSANPGAITSVIREPEWQILTTTGGGNANLAVRAPLPAVIREPEWQILTATGGGNANLAIRAPLPGVIL